MERASAGHFLPNIPIREERRSRGLEQFREPEDAAEDLWAAVFKVRDSAISYKDAKGKQESFSVEMVLALAP
jgi:hypothetical protein